MGKIALQRVQLICTGLPALSFFSEQPRMLSHFSTETLFHEKHGKHLSGIILIITKVAFNNDTQYLSVGTNLDCLFNRRMQLQKNAM